MIVWCVAAVLGWNAGDAKVETAVNPAPVVTGNTAFALETYGKLRAGGGNLFFSPYSISSALAMTYAGARGETAQEMRRTLHLPEGDATHKAFAAILRDTNSAPDNPFYTLLCANALWLQAGDPFRPEFLATVRDDYQAGLFAVNYRDSAQREAARMQINEWVAKNTQDKIQNLIGQGTLNAYTSLVLTNAIYFKAAWSTPFRENLTKKDDAFHTADGRNVPVAMMHHASPTRVRYGETATYQVVELPYSGSGLAMDVLLPRAADGLPALEATLSEPTLNKLLEETKVRPVIVELPKFRLEAAVELSAMLKAMGMRQAFEPNQADFSGISGSRELAISAVIHKAFVDVTEQGTEAAAATAVAVGALAARPVPEAPVRFRADHPFLFLIRDTRSGTILFVGRLIEPSK